MKAPNETKQIMAMIPLVFLTESAMAYFVFFLKIQECFGVKFWIEKNTSFPHNS